MDKLTDFEAIIVPITIRDGVRVRIEGIPHDLTQEEAQKIANIILAFAKPEEGIENG